MWALSAAQRPTLGRTSIVHNFIVVLVHTTTPGIGLSLGPRTHPHVKSMRATCGAFEGCGIFWFATLGSSVQSFFALDQGWCMQRNEP